MSWKITKLRLQPHLPGDNETISEMSFVEKYEQQDLATQQICLFLPLGLSGWRDIDICLSVRLYTLPRPHDNSSQIWAGIVKFAPNMHHGIFSTVIENGVPDLDLHGHFRHFDSEF